MSREDSDSKIPLGDVKIFPQGEGRDLKFIIQGKMLENNDTSVVEYELFTKRYYRSRLIMNAIANYTRRNS